MVDWDTKVNQPLLKDLLALSEEVYALSGYHVRLEINCESGLPTARASLPAMAVEIRNHGQQLSEIVLRDSPCERFSNSLLELREDNTSLVLVAASLKKV